MAPSKRSAADLDSSDEAVVKGETKKTKVVRTKWTAEEEAIFAEISEKVLKAGLWEAIKADGRLVHRKANGIGMKIPSMIKKMGK